MDNNSRIEKVKRKIESLMIRGFNNEAIELLEKIIEKNINDVEVYSMYSVALNIIGEYNKAINSCLEGLDIDPYNFDLNYNLACLYENINEYSKALTYFNIALNECKNAEIKENIDNIINNKIYKNYDIQNKMVFFVKRGLDSFLPDIINELSNDYIVKKVIVDDFSYIDKWMEWADISWFEWCDELVNYGSKLPIANMKKIICRIHGYEVYTNYINNVAWSNVDNLIIVTPHIRRIFEERTNNLDKGNLKINTIFCGINLEKYDLNIKSKGFNLGYLGYINYKKNIPLTLDIFKKLYDMDNRYKLHIAGEFQDERTLSYLKYFIKEYKLEKSFVFYGWLNEKEKNEWFKNIDYMIISSIDEGLCFAAAEAMSAGIKPILHNCEGIKDHYDKKYIFNTIDESIEMIKSEDYKSVEYRKFIKENYSLNKQMKEINQVINRVLSLEKNKIIKYKNFIYKEKDIKFYLPYLNDWVQKIIYQTNNFYEKEMLEDILNRLKENNIIIDIGANIGNHTIFFSRVCKTKKVYSFEPQRDIFEILKKNVELNKVEEIVELYNMGLGKERELANIKVIDKMNYGSSKLEKGEEGDIEINKLDNIIPIDELEKIDVIKIDVEGMELDVLEGAKEILRRFKPILYIEAGTEREFYDLVVFLKEFGYKVIQRFNATPTYLFINEE